MFKRYKLRKSKQNQEPKIVKQNLIPINSHKQKTDLEKLRSLLSAQNRMTAFKRIKNLDTSTFDLYIYFITVSVLSEYINDKNEILCQCIKRIVNSENFELVVDVFNVYCKAMVDDKEVLDMINKKHKGEWKKCDGNLVKNKPITNFKIDDDIFISR